MSKELEYLPAFILHTRPFKENQLLMEMLVAGEGRISIIGYKGSKKNTAKTALMQPFRALVVQFKKNAGLRTLKTLDENQLLSKQLSALKSKSLFCGFYLNEVICRLCTADAEYETLYPLYVYSLRNLSDLSLSANSHLDDAHTNLYLEWILRQFEHRLLQMLGYGISFEQELTMQQSICEDLHYQLLGDQGFVIDAAKPSSLHGKDLLAVSAHLNTQVSLEDFVLLDNEAFLAFKRELTIAKSILRVCLHRHLGDKPLKSRELFRR